MKRMLFLIGTALLAAVTPVAAQNVGPVVTSQIANFTVYANAPSRSIDLTTAFADPDVSDAVRLTTVLGNIDLALYGQQKPITVANFLKYVDQGRYFLSDTSGAGSSFVHRSVPGFVIQGGGFIRTPDTTYSVLTFPPIQNEPGISNKRGTVAMAKLSNDVNSATSQWFINLADNGGPPNNLDTTNGGFTVFGRVVNNGMSTADAIAALPRVNVGAPFDQLPVRNYTSPNPVKLENLVSVPAIARIATMTFSAVTNNTTSIDVQVSGSKLLVSGKQPGNGTVIVTATDTDGAQVSQSFTVTVIAAPGRLVNVSTRMQVGTGDNALFVGFIMSGSASKRLVIRALGPSTGVAGAVANPTLELLDNSRTTIGTNDNWGDAANKQDVIDIGLAPSSPNESVILTTVPSSTSGTAYTAIMRGAGNTTGLGVVEVYDLDSGPGSTLLNVATRGQVGTDPNALIGGFILGGTTNKQVLVRAIGPSLTPFGIPNALTNPTLDFFNAQGTKIDSNDDWMTSPQKTQIENSGLAPSNPKESAIIQTISAGNYTAVVHGVNGEVGVGTVEVYQLP